MTFSIVTRVVREEMFTFTPEGETDEVHIRSGMLREWLQANAMGKVIDLTFPSDETEEQIIERHGLEAPRMASMTLLEAADPVIVALWPGGTHVLVDGGHRRWFWFKRGVHTIKGWAVPPAIWTQFIFDPKDMPTAIHHRDGSLLPQRMKK